jgi:hypothetical protein
MTLKENYNKIINKIEELKNSSDSYISEETKQSIDILLFKVKNDEDKDEMLKIIDKQFNLFGDNEESPLELLQAKKIKLDNLFKKNKNFL